MPRGQSLGRDDVAHGAAHGQKFQEIAEDRMGGLAVGLAGQAHDGHPGHGQQKTGQGLDFKLFFKNNGGGHGVNSGSRAVTMAAWEAWVMVRALASKTK
ncbi:MAG: hypothetical protein AB9872_00590 [Solidesulfovibrio sp.]